MRIVLSLFPTARTSVIATGILNIKLYRVNTALWSEHKVRSYSTTAHSYTDYSQEQCEAKKKSLLKLSLTIFVIISYGCMMPLQG